MENKKERAVEYTRQGARYLPFYREGDGYLLWDSRDQTTHGGGPNQPENDDEARAQADRWNTLSR